MNLTTLTVKDERWNLSFKKFQPGTRIFVCYSSFAEKDIPKNAAFYWHPENRKWFTDDRANACKLAEWADSTCKAELEATRIDRLKSIEASRSAEHDAVYPAPDGLDYMPFQKAGIAYANGRKDRSPRIIIGDEMGLGKTIQAIGMINTNPEIRTVLVVCPASLKINWYRELRKWLVDKSLRIGIGDTKIFPGPANGFNITILNYEALAKKFENPDPKMKDGWKYIHPELKDIEWDLLVGDEIHMCKSTKSLRSKGFYGLRCKRALLLTGTPILNKPMEIYPLIEYCDPEYWNPKWSYFRNHYAGTWHNNTFYKAEEALRDPKVAPKMQAALNDLQDRLRATIFIRRMKEQVLKELPPKRRQIIEFDATGAARATVDAEKAAMSRKEAVLESLKYAVEMAKMADDDQAYSEAVGNLTKAAKVAFEEIAKVRHDTAVAKIPYVIQHLKACLEEQAKVVCMCVHHDVAHALKDEFGNEAVMVTGSLDTEIRQKSVDAFQLNPNVRLFIGTKAAWVGITLTAASHVVFAELDFVPGLISQAEDRLHRYGQTESVNVQHLVLEGSLDARMAEVIVAKQEIIDAALDSERREMVDAVALPTEKDRVQVSRTGLVNAAAKLTPAQIEAIHEGLQMLAGMCDGAHALDGAGFSKVDTRIGHDLARLPRLTPKQAAYGAKLVKKYRRQLPENILQAAA